MPPILTSLLDSLVLCPKLAARYRNKRADVMKPTRRSRALIGIKFGGFGCFTVNVSAVTSRITEKVSVAKSLLRH